MVRNNLHDDKCHRMIWGSYLNCSKFNFLYSIIKNASIRKSDQQSKIEEYSCIYVIIGALQALCMVFKTYNLWKAIISPYYSVGMINPTQRLTRVCVLWLHNICSQRLRHWPAHDKPVNLQGSSVHIQLYFYSRRF